MTRSTCLINGQTIELKLLSESEVIELFGAREQVTRVAEVLTEGDGKESASFKARLKLPVDKYGFYIEAIVEDDDQFHKSLQISQSTQRQRDAKEKERLQKWLDMRRAGMGTNSVQRKVQERCRKGIPHKVREWAWYSISAAERFSTLFPSQQPSSSSSSTQRELPAADVPNATTRDDIERDITRTFPRHSLFMRRNGPGQASLRRLLCCYASHDPEVGYCQGMGFIAGMMLTIMDESKALATFIAALSGPNTTNPRSNSAHSLSFKLREMYLPSMSGAQRVLHVFQGLGRKHLPVLWDHLEGEGMHPTMYATEWFMTMFCRGFNFDLCMRVWDIFLQEDFKVVYRVALALIKNVEKKLLAATFEGIMGLLRRLPENTDAAAVMEIAWKIPVSRGEIYKLEQEWQAEHGKDV